MVVMEQQEHIATLCAAGTVGIAVAGFALGTEDNNNNQLTTPGKRKRPGASSTKSPTTPQIPFTGARRVVSQPTTSTSTPQEKDQVSLASSLFRRKTVKDLRPHTGNQSDTTAESRASSLNRSGILRPRTADTRTTSERRDTSAGSSWLKRISTVSSLHGISPAASVRRLDDTANQSSSHSRVASTDNLMPNKLVKRSTSQRALSTDHAQGSFLRRPATSHQRTATLREWDAHRHRRVATATSSLTHEIPEMEPSSPPVWRPFFERGYPRKRHSTGGVRDTQPVRTITPIGYGQPTLILGRLVEPTESLEDQIDRSPTAQEEFPITSNRQRLRRSLSSMHRASRRRYFTDPVVKTNTETANGTISPAIKQSPLSPISHSSTFDIDLPHGSPAFGSSPTFIPVRHRFSFRKRESAAPSDPTTISSDNDTQVFTDDESMDDRSDTNYDSLNTRATASSHSAMRPPKLETIFHAAQDSSIGGPTATLEELMRNTTLSNTGPSSTEEIDHRPKTYGIGISGFEDNSDDTDVQMGESASLTPVKTTATGGDEWLATPVPIKPALIKDRMQHPPHSMEGLEMTSPLPEDQLNTQLHSDDEDNIDWSPASNDLEQRSRVRLPSDAARTLSDMCSSHFMSGTETDVNLDDQLQTDKRVSIFDWSEQQRNMGDSNGGDARPKTVHGKQVNDNSRSRSSGRKAPNQLHLRSQSVPNNRDSQVEPTPSSTSKFSTWGLGHKPVSEEWSDDFEFDDVDEEQEELPQLSVSSAEPLDRGSLRGVKVPQSIIDRQASVHIQFGQVQEFMLLVEELKRLRARGLALDLVQKHSKQLWDDAENIINLATINNEEDEIEDICPPTPTILEAFGEELVVGMRGSDSLDIGEEVGRNSTSQRPFSNPATPPHGRPRGESLAQAKTFLQNIHQSRGNNESSPLTFDDQPLKKLPFDTQDLKDLVFRSGVITRALKEIVRKAEGVSLSPNKTPPRHRDPAFSQIFNAPDISPCPPYRNPTIPKSRSAHSYLSTSIENNNNGEMSNSFTTLQAAMCS